LTTPGWARLTQPGALRSAGWGVGQVPVTAWQENPDDVLRLIDHPPAE
jgi:alpha-D-ribose 1-methylphosphonate 5-phosphate C-P lyase